MIYQFAFYLQWFLFCVVYINCDRPLYILLMFDLDVLLHYVLCSHHRHSNNMGLGTVRSMQVFCVSVVTALSPSLATPVVFSLFMFMEIFSAGCDTTITLLAPPRPCFYAHMHCRSTVINLNGRW
jgi:hypothetical protein